MAGLSRSTLFARGAKCGIVLAAAGTVGGFGARAAFADNLTDGDLAYLRLLIGAELLAADFYTNALQAEPFGANGEKALKRALFNEGEHYAALAGYVSGVGQTPATAADIDFSYPAGTFASTASIGKLAVSLETTFLGAYLGAIAGVQAASLRQPLAQIAANQAQHLTVFSQLLGRPGFALSFPAPLTIAAASDALAGYTA